MIDYWILDEHHNVVRAKDVIEWGEFFHSPEHIVARSYFWWGRISTVFLGIDHSFRFLEEEPGAPVVFESMVFGHNSWSELAMDRYTTWDEAETGHARLMHEWHTKPWSFKFKLWFMGSLRPIKAWYQKSRLYIIWLYTIARKRPTANT